MIVHDVMAEALRRSWWTGYRGKQQARFEQAELIVRVWPIEQR
jgi:hypothetical protein